MDLWAEIYYPEASYNPELRRAASQFERLFRGILNGIEEKNQEFFEEKRRALTAELEKFKSSPEWAKLQAKGRSEAIGRFMEGHDKEARLERLKKEFKEYSDRLYAAASSRLRAEVTAIREEALRHFRGRSRDDDASCHKLSAALDDVLDIGDSTAKPSSQLFDCPLYHEGFSRLNPIDLTK